MTRLAHVFRRFIAVIIDPNTPEGISLASRAWVGFDDGVAGWFRKLIGLSQKTASDLPLEVNTNENSMDPMAHLMGADRLDKMVALAVPMAVATATRSAGTGSRSLVCQNPWRCGCGCRWLGL